MTATEWQRLKGFLGLCARAGETVLGQDACVDAVRRETAAVVLMDERSAQNTRKRFLDSCANHHVPLYSIPAEMITQAVGKEGRMTVAIKRGKMADKLLLLLGGENPLSGAG